MWVTEMLVAKGEGEEACGCKALVPGHRLFSVLTPWTIGDWSPHLPPTPLFPSVFTLRSFISCLFTCCLSSPSFSFASPLSSCSLSPSITPASLTFFCLPSFLLCLLFHPPLHCNTSTLTLTPSYSLQSPSSYFYILLFLLFLSLFNFLSYPSTSLNCTVSFQQCATNQSSSLVPLPPFPAPVGSLPPPPNLPPSPYSCPSRPFLSARLHVRLSFLPPTQVILVPGLDPHWLGGVSPLIVTVINICEAGSWDTQHLCHRSLFLLWSDLCWVLLQHRISNHSMTPE